MDNNKFELLIAVLESLENEDINNSDLETAIVKIINKFDSNLTEEQKVNILREFIRYEKLRREKNASKSFDEEEMNRELLETFLAGETFRWGE